MGDILLFLSFRDPGVVISFISYRIDKSPSRTMKSLLVALSLFVISGQCQEINTLGPSLDEHVIPISLMNRREGEAIKQRETFAPTSNLIINVTDIPADISFFILQIHTYQYNVSLSYDKSNVNKVSNTSLFGSNIGLFVKPKKKGPTQVFLRNDNVRTVEALLAVIPYTKEAPIPGGCNMEFNIEEAPYQKLVVNGAIVTVDLQPASLPPMYNKTAKSCEKYPVHHDAYRVYLVERDYSVESYFNAIASMLTVEDIIRNGEKVPPPVTSSSYRRIYSNYYGIGSVYAAVATYGNHSSAYVPTFTYGCNYVLYPEDCYILNATMATVLCVLVLLAGFLCVFFGHLFPPFEVWMITTIFYVIISYVIIKSADPSDTTSDLGKSIGISLIFLILLCICSVYKKINLANVVSTFTCGCLCGSIIYFTVPGSTGLWESNWAFWFIYFTIAIIFTIIPLVIVPCRVLTTAAVSSFMVILPIDYFAGSSFKYIIINVIRRMTVPQFNYAIVSPPFQSKEISLLVFWILLALLRIVNHCCGSTLFCCRSKNQFTQISEHTPILEDTPTLEDNPIFSNWHLTSTYRNNDRLNGQLPRRTPRNLRLYLMS